MTLAAPLGQSQVLTPIQGGTGFDASTVAPNQVLVTNGTTGYTARAYTGQSARESVFATTAAVLPNAPTYYNGAQGVGATLTASANAVLLIDGVNPAINERVGVITQAAAAQNGIYTVTDPGSAGTPWILTRATDANHAGAPAPDLHIGIYFFTEAGTVNTGLAFELITQGVIVVGTTALTFTQTGGATGIVPGSNNFGYLNPPLNSQSANYSFQLTDVGKNIYHPSADVTARTWTLDLSLAWPADTMFMVSNAFGAGVITIVFTNGTGYLNGMPNATGNRTLTGVGQGVITIPVAGIAQISAGNGVT